MSTNEELATRLSALARDLKAEGAWQIGVGSAIEDIVTELRGVQVTENKHAWRSPVDNPAAWYCAVWHDPTGQRNIWNGKPYQHTGIDLNLETLGDTDRNEPVYSISDGQVVAATSSSGWLGVVVIEHTYNGNPLWVRYAHLNPAHIEVRQDQMVPVGKLLGKIGNWTGGDGGDHLHFDMSVKYFKWNVWRPASGDVQGFIDPVPVLRDVLGDEIADGLLKKGNG